MVVGKEKEFSHLYCCSDIIRVQQTINGEIMGDDTYVRDLR